MAGAIVDWAEDKKLSRPFHGAASRFDELFEGNLSTEDLDGLYAQCVLSRVTASAKNVRKCIRRSREQYVESFAALMERLLQRPWQMAVFRVVELHGDGRQTISVLERDGMAGEAGEAGPEGSAGPQKPAGAAMKPGAADEAGEAGRSKAAAPGERVLVSPTVEALYKRGERLFGSLLIDAGEELYTYGGVFFYRAFDDEDFRQFARGADAALYRSKGLGAVLSAYPAEFIGLYAFATQPRSELGGEEMRYCQSRVGLEGRSFEELAAGLQDLDVDRKAPFFRLSLKDAAMSESGFSSSFVAVGDESRQVVWLYSLLRSGYEHGRAALQPLLEFPEEPEVNLSSGMLSAMDSLLGFTIEAERIEKEMLPEDSPEQATFIESVNRAADRLSQAVNAGRKIDQRLIEQLAAEEGIDPAALEELSSQLSAEASSGQSSGQSSEQSLGQSSEQIRQDFFGLSQEMMRRLLLGGWDEITDIVELRKPQHVGPEEAPVLACAVQLLHILEAEGPIKEVSSSGNLPKDVADRFSLQPDRGEEGVPHLQLARILLELSGIIEHSEGEFRLPGQGAEPFDGPHTRVSKLDMGELYFELLKNFIGEFNWEYLYEYNVVEVPLVRGAVVFLLHVLRSLPVITARKVNQVFLQAFPAVEQDITNRLSEHSQAETPGFEEISQITEDAVYSQFFMQLLLMFGLATTEKQQRTTSAATRWRLTPLCEKVFNWKIPAF